MITVGSQALFNLGIGTQPNDLDIWDVEGSGSEVYGADYSIMPKEAE